MRKFSACLMFGAALSACALCAPTTAKGAARSVVVHLVNKTNYSLSLISAGFTASNEGEWVTKPPQTIAAHATGTWKSQSSGFLRGVEGSANYRANGPNTTVKVGWDNPYAGVNSYTCSAPSGLTIEHSGGTGNDSTVTFTLSPPFSLPLGVKVTSLKVRIITGQDFGAGTDDDVYFDIGPLGWFLDKPNHNDFERNEDDTYDLPLSGVSLMTDDIIHARVQKKGIGGWTGSPDGVGGPWECQSIHFIVNGVDSGPIAVNAWLDHGHPFWKHVLRPFSDSETFIRTLRMTTNPMLTKSSENVAILTTPFKEMGLSGWLGSDVGNVTAIGKVVFTPGQSTDGLATIDLDLESIQIAKPFKTYVFSGPNKTPGINGPRFLRVEYKFRQFGAFTGGKPLPDKGDRVQISGPIFVDTDKEGYYEIHPTQPGQVKMWDPLESTCRHASLSIL